MRAELRSRRYGLDAMTITKQHDRKPDQACDDIRALDAGRRGENEVERGGEQPRRADPKSALDLEEATGTGADAARTTQAPP